MVRMTTRVPGEASATEGIASSDEGSPGMLRSSTRTSGLWPRVKRSASSAVPATATTSMSSSASSSSFSPERTTAWSSASTIVRAIAPMLAASLDRSPEPAELLAVEAPLQQREELAFLETHVGGEQLANLARLLDRGVRGRPAQAHRDGERPVVVARQRCQLV